MSVIAPHAPTTLPAAAPRAAASRGTRVLDAYAWAALAGGAVAGASLVVAQDARDGALALALVGGVALVLLGVAPRAQALAGGALVLAASVTLVPRAPLAALAFVAAGAALVARGASPARARRASDALALVSAGVGYVGAIATAYGTRAFASGPLALAPASSVALLLVGTSLLAKDAPDGILARVTAPTPGGAVLRQVGPFVALLAAVAGGAAILAQGAGGFDAATTTTIGATSGLGIMLTFLFVVASRLDRADALRRRAEAEALQRARDLEAINRELGSFSYSVSHDLRAPLRALDGFSVALEEDAGDALSDAARDDVRRIREASARMSALIEDMLVLSRVSRAELHPQDVDVTLRARAIGEELSREHPERRVTLDVAPGLRASVDPPLLDTLLRHLLENAWKFTGRRSDDARVTVGIESRDGNAAFFVRDNGVGFDPRFVGKLFRPFQRLHAKSEFPGNGIGLAIVARIVARHGGAAWAQGAVGQGATLYFTLPQKADP